MSQSINKNNLKNKTAVITGGTRGIGKAISAELGRRGVNLILNYLRNHKEAKKTQKELNESNVNCSIYRCNIGDIESVDKFINKIALEHNKIDILINNAASGVMKKSTDLDVKHWDWTMDINARGTWYISKKLSNHMVNGGNIINISSPGSSMVLPDYFPIGVSKAALEAITRYLSIELSEKKISARPHPAAKRYSSKTLKIDEFVLFRKTNFALLRHPVDESQKYFRGEVPSSRRFF